MNTTSRQVAWTVGAILLALAVGVGGLGLYAQSTGDWPQDAVGQPVSAGDAQLPPIPTHPALTATSVQHIGTAVTGDSLAPTATQAGAVPGLVLTPANATPDWSNLVTAEPLPTLSPPEQVFVTENQGPGRTPEIELAPGTYRIHGTFAEPGATVVPVVLEGPCSEYPLWIELGTVRGSAVYRSAGCTLQFEAAGFNGGWVLSVETAASGGVETIPASFAGDGPSATAVVDVPEGMVHLKLTTASRYAMVTPIVVSGLCLERPAILADQPGTTFADYYSGGCLLIFQVSSVTASWELTITRDQ